jgi:hypothetical protein
MYIKRRRGCFLLEKVSLAFFAIEQIFVKTCVLSINCCGECALNSLSAQLHIALYVYKLRFASAAQHF